MVAQHYQQLSVKEDKLTNNYPFYDAVTNTSYPDIAKVLDVIYTKFPDFLGAYTRLDIKQILFYYLVRCGRAIKIKEIILIDQKWYKEPLKDPLYLETIITTNFYNMKKSPKEIIMQQTLFNATKKPFTVSVLIWDGTEDDRLDEFCKGTTRTHKATLFRKGFNYSEIGLMVKTPLGKVILNKGDYIVKESANVFYVYTEAEFFDKYNL